MSVSAIKDNFILIGMPGSGKSTLGLRIANSLNLDFLDADKLIEARESMPVQQIINQRGTDYFRSVEQAVLCGLDVRSTLLATGGSAVLSEITMRHLADLGTLIYLRISLTTMMQRVQDKHSRGLVKKRSDSLQDLYIQRLPIYQQWGEHVIDNDEPLTELRYSELLQTISAVK